MLKGFKDFLIRGNVIDLAVGLIMGTAFTAVVNALVQSVLMPAISMLVKSPTNSWSSTRSRSACS